MVSFDGVVLWRDRYERIGMNGERILRYRPCERSSRRWRRPSMNSSNGWISYPMTYESGVGAVRHLLSSREPGAWQIGWGSPWMNRRHLPSISIVLRRLWARKESISPRAYCLRQKTSK